jgi:L-lactate dehydrogenase complex protein LldG
MSTAREAILARVREALGRNPATPPPPLPATARISPRSAGPADAEIDLLLSEIDALRGVTRRLAGREALRPALAELVRSEQVSKATLWTTPDLLAWDVAGTLATLGVSIVPAQAGSRLVAECELGVTGVDAALAETGTLLLTSSPERPRVVSLLPRVHLAILTAQALRADLHQAFAEAKSQGYSVLVSGPSRTADIELTLTLGVHGPKSLYVWVMDTP